MKKSCQNCGLSSYNTEYGFCEDNPLKKAGCSTYSQWIPVVFKPSEMDLLALESLRDGREVYDECGEKIIITSIQKENYVGRHILNKIHYVATKICLDKPCTDLTKEEVKEHLFEKVWV